MATEPISTPRTNDQAPDGSFNTKTAAALFGGAVVATAGAYFGTRALAKHHRTKSDQPINSVMATAITAYDVSPQATVRIQPVSAPKSKA